MRLYVTHLYIYINILNDVEAHTGSKCLLKFVNLSNL